MADRGVDGYEQIQTFEDCHRVGVVANFGAEIDQRCAAPIAADLRLGRALLQRHKDNPRQL
jgi:hypothetical protein